MFILILGEHMLPTMRTTGLERLCISWSLDDYPKQILNLRYLARFSVPSYSRSSCLQFNFLQIRPPPKKGNQLSFIFRFRFESLTLSHNNMIALKPVLSAWLEEAEAAKRDPDRCGNGGYESPGPSV